ncbi:MAG: Asp-tRNA(Asn)/Glu-tRNA(Gln) amidotransferase subunit GatB, partial [Fidelibacterota bacterium]
MSKISPILREWEAVIGLEAHAQLSTRTKMFCSCLNAYGDPPNTHTCPVCLGLPGSLPVPNARAIEYALRLGVALGCEITPFSRFARKNYFYPDLPKGYQISQYEEPLCRGGSVKIRLGGSTKEIPLIRIHLEEDAGKSIHAHRDNGTAVDFNRCGVPLVEIVTEPVIRTPLEARVYLSTLKQILQYLDICDCNMEEGNLRCDANISVRPRGKSVMGTKTEMKNLNSFRSVERGLEYEIERQAGLLKKGEKVDHVTLLWNEELRKAEVMRTKEEAHDYRYFPDPDLVPVTVSEKRLSEIRAALPELPHEREERLVKEFALRLEDVLILTSDPGFADYFEEAVDLGADPKEASKWMVGEVTRILKEKSWEMEAFPVRPDRFVALLDSVRKKDV